MAFISTELRPQGEVQQKVGRLRLSEAIRIGAPSVSEKRGWCGCAIGAAHFAISGQLFFGGGYNCGNIVEEWARAHGFNPRQARKAEEMFNSGSSYLEVADWLAARGL